MATITLSQLARRYGRYTAIDGVNLVVRDGEVLSLLGPAGCGKSTILRVIAGLVDPTAGSVALDGRIISSAHGSVPPERRAMAMLFNAIALWPHLNAFENVAFGLRQTNLDGPTLGNRVGGALEMAGAQKLANKTPNQLSLPDRCRVALARALAVEPRVLLLDDALGKLDPADRQTLAIEIRRLQKQLRLTTVAVTADANEAMLLSDRIGAVNRGRVEQVDTPGALYMQPETRFVAKLLGRALLFEGQRTGKQISFAGFNIETARLRNGAGAAGPVTACLRPEHLALLRPNEPAQDGWLTRTGRIQQRTFVGAHWDYVFAAEPDGTVFEVSAPNTNVFDAGAQAAVAFDPSRAVLVN
jgi:ABC-type Fe3+/spermidine/putrescine transport system ATPase subunit